jgi:hypothetical protein
VRSGGRHRGGWDESWEPWQGGGRAGGGGRPDARGEGWEPWRGGRRVGGILAKSSIPGTFWMEYNSSEQGLLTGRLV